MKQKNLIRGIIYEDHKKLDELTHGTSLILSDLTDYTGEFYDKILSECKCPTKEEFYVSATIDAICRPSPYEENMIIPASLVNDGLYNVLKKIDIGEGIRNEYINIRENKFLDECEAKGINQQPMFKSDEEKLSFIEEKCGRKPECKVRKIHIA